MSDPIEGKLPEYNPYEAPRADVAPPNSSSNFQSPFSKGTPNEIRERYLAREATVRAIGLVTMLAGVFTIVNLGVSFLASLWPTPIDGQAATDEQSTSNIGISLVVINLWMAVFYITFGLQLRGLKNWARCWLIVLMGLVLLGNARVTINSETLKMALSADLETLNYLFVFGIHLFLLVNLMQSDSKFVCSAFYRTMIFRTPQLRPTFGVRDWILVVFSLIAYLTSTVLLFLE